MFQFTHRNYIIYRLHVHSSQDVKKLFFYSLIHTCKSYILRFVHVFHE